MSSVRSSTMGGIVWKYHSGQRTIAILSGLNGTREWKLPVIEPNGSQLSQSARFQKIGRLVGAELDHIQIADSLFYPEREPPGVVVFWHLQVKPGGRKIEQPKGVQVKWLRPERAAELITDRQEKQLILQVNYPDEAENGVYKSLSKDGDLNLNPNSKPKPVNKSAFERLEGDLQSFSGELEFLIRDNLLPDGSIPPWGEQAGALLNIAARQMRIGKLDAAWKSLHTSKRLALFALEQQDVPKMAERIRHEANNLNEWRKQSVLNILSENNDGQISIDNMSLFLAAQIRDEHFNNNYYKNRLTRNVIKTLMILLAVSLAAIFMYFIVLSQLNLSNLISFNGENRVIQEVPLLIGILLFGLFGGVVSSLFKVKTVDNSLRNPEILNNYLFTTIRVFMGGAAAIAIFILLESEFSDIVFGNFSLRPENHFTYFAIAFVCGFSERLLMKAVSKISE
ncbi:hypothetical protein DYD21_15020 [Rhodohalobacter sp. SW132]|uniref:hypothetical protein n=1 Tax=Rhodohalobacter sp. SW132 TaxID=2293433 RepID=UPI000E3635D2|nr:hypothetical protein [Rhodohalobacter sp. SW132]REL29163.1 hypothetical protein DYD21_15020 [Rhodohalobacter sp. SW132]